MNARAVSGNASRQWHVAAWFDEDGFWNIRWRDRQGREWTELYEVRPRPTNFH